MMLSPSVTCQTCKLRYHKLFRAFRSNEEKKQELQTDLANLHEHITGVGPLIIRREPNDFAVFGKTSHLSADVGSAHLSARIRNLLRKPLRVSPQHAQDN